MNELDNIDVYGPGTSYDYDGGELNNVDIPGYSGDSGNSDYAWDYNWDNYDNDSTQNQDTSSGDYNTGTNNDPNSGGNPNATPAPKPPASKIILTKKVKPGQIHTQRVAALRDHNQLATFVSQLMVNGVAVGTVTFSNPQIDANGVEIYTVLTVEVFYDSPVAITNVVLNEIDDRDSQNFTNSSTNGVTIDITGDVSNYPTLGLVEFVLPMNETEDLEIIATRNIDESKLEKKDPCVVAKELTTIATNPIYQKAVKDIKTAAAADGFEHAITLGKSSAGQVIATPMSQGTKSSVTIDYSIPGAFTRIHNHPSENSHSVQDLYNTVVLNNMFPNFNSGFVLAGNDVYVAAVTDLTAAQVFANKYIIKPTASDPAFFLKFISDEIADAWNDMDTYLPEGKTKAVAFVANKYNAGITFFKQNNNGDFYPLITKEVKQSNGSRTFNLIPCI